MKPSLAPKFYKHLILLSVIVMQLFYVAYGDEFSAILSAKDGEYNLSKPLLFDKVKSTTIGNSDEILVPTSFGINYISLSSNGNLIEIDYNDGDVMGPFRFRHIPQLPMLNDLKKMNNLPDLSSKLGRPHLRHEKQGIAKWAFFSINGNSISIVYIIFLKTENKVGLRIGEGSTSGNIAIKQFDPLPK